VSRLIVIVLSAAVVGGLAGAGVGLALGADRSGTTTIESTTARTASQASAAEGALAPDQIYRSAAPAVVVITDMQTQVVPPTLFTPPAKQEVGALGSGFVIDSKGDIVTNDHVVQGATGIRVGLASGVSYPAKIVGTDPTSDIAVVRVHAPAATLQPLAFADSAKVSVGDPAYAIGNPFGLDRTMTAGIVSATGRDIDAPNGFTIPNTIQTDASINHGNSGGPLLDGRGEVIGVNSQIQGGSVDGNVGIGFAVPSDTAKSVATQLIASGHASHAWLGVRVDTIDPTVAKVVRGLPEQGVVVVSVVKGGPAAKARLLAATKRVSVNGVVALVGGDSIVALDGTRIADAAQLAGLLAARRPGEKVELEVVRNGARRKVVLTLGDVPRASG
jgi:putative serine protease PepD